MRQGWLGLMLGAVLATAAPAQTLDVNDRTFLVSAVAVMGYDMFAARCTAQNAFTPAEQEKVSTWQRVNEVALVRARVAELERDEALHARFEQLRAGFEKQFASYEDRAACAAAVSLVGERQAQFAANSPEMLRALRARSGATVAAGGRNAGAGTESPRSTPSSSPPAAPPRPADPAARAATSALVQRIESFGFDTRPEMGMGGWIGIKVYPVVLFRDGTALTDVAGLGFPGGIDAHRRADAGDWTRWRRAGGEVQLLKDGKWDKLEFQRTYGTLPRDFRLNGRFRRSAGTGNIAIGGTASVTVVSQYLFAPDGRVVRDGSTGSTASAGDISVATSGASPAQRGRYTIDGITLNIRYDDGSEERRILVTDPTDPKSVIWLDGDSYVRR
ncbi:MAG: hypothetical protein IT355_14285 [Gemmatimonadaceae bacterium]|nr:hypothetical protein [Gemmatimonadaceae bacterium]